MSKTIKRTTYNIQYATKSKIGNKVKNLLIGLVLDNNLDATEYINITINIASIKIRKVMIDTKPTLIIHATNYRSARMEPFCVTIDNLMIIDTVAKRLIPAIREEVKFQNNIATDYNGDIIFEHTY